MMLLYFYKHLSSIVCNSIDLSTENIIASLENDKQKPLLDMLNLN